MAQNFNMPPSMSDMDSSEQALMLQNRLMEQQQQMQRWKFLAEKNSKMFGPDMSAMINMALKNPRSDSRIDAFMQSSGLMQALGGNTMAIGNAAFLGTTSGSFNISDPWFGQQTLLRDPMGGTGRFHAGIAQNVSKEIQRRSFFENGQTNYNYTRGFQAEQIGEVMNMAGGMGAFRGPGVLANTPGGVNQIGEEMRHMLKAIENIQDTFDTPDIKESFQKIEQLGLRGGMRMDARRMSRVTDQLKTLARSTGLGASAIADYMELSTGQFRSMGFSGEQPASLAMSSLAFASSAQGRSNMDFHSLQQGFTGLMGRAAGSDPGKTAAYLHSLDQKGLLTPGASAALNEFQLHGDTDQLRQAMERQAGESGTPLTRMLGLVNDAQGINPFGLDATHTTMWAEGMVKGIGKRVGQNMDINMMHRLGPDQADLRARIVQGVEAGMSPEQLRAMLAASGVSDIMQKGILQDLSDARTQVNTQLSPEEGEAASLMQKAGVRGQSSAMTQMAIEHGEFSYMEKFDPNKASSAEVLAQAMFERDPEKRKMMRSRTRLLTLSSEDLDMLSPGRSGIMRTDDERKHIEMLQSTWKSDKSSPEEKQKAFRELQHARLQYTSEFEARDPGTFARYMSDTQPSAKAPAKAGETKGGFPNAVKILNAQGHEIGSLEFMNK